MNLINVTLWTGTGSGLFVSMLEKLNWFCLNGKTGVVDEKMHGSIF